MTYLTVNEQGGYFEKNGKPFFLLADTIWSAFTNLSEKEWSEYLSVRKKQGFNALQINALEQWDRGESKYALLPFEKNEDGSYNFRKPSEKYFEHAKKLCQMAKEEGFELELVLLWCNYVPDTWANMFMKLNTVPEEDLEFLTRYLMDTFDAFEPVYIVGGDTDFPSENTCRYYRTVFDILEERNSKSLKTIHIKGRFTEIPEEFKDRMDFYMYQSGHNIDGQQDAYVNAQILSSFTPARPVVNSEPCYEQMGYSHMLYGRFTQRDIRKAAWQSVLSGAGAGVTYGAHGIWNWVERGMKNSLAAGEGFLSALPHDAALRYPGAEDYGFIRNLFQSEELLGLRPAQELIGYKSEEIRASKKDNKFVIYMPYNVSLPLTADLSDRKIRCIDLSNGRVVEHHIEKTDKGSCIPIHDFLEDVIYIIG